MNQPNNQIRNLNALLDVAKAMGREVELDSLLQTIVAHTTEVMDAERSSLFLFDPEKNELWSKVAEGIIIKEIRFPADKGIAGYVVKNKEVLNIEDAYKDPRFNQQVDVDTGFHTRSILCMPIVTKDDRLLGVIQVLNKITSKHFTSEDVNLLEALVSQIEVALERATLIEESLEKKRIEESIKLAHEIQMGLLPKTFPAFPERKELDIYAITKPAKGVCGDFYDFFLVDDDHLAFVIGDVSGKGIPAAFFMAVTKTLIKTLTTAAISPGELLAKVNNDLYDQNDSGMFVTVFYGILNFKTGELRYSNGGHNPPYIYDSNNETSKELTAGGIALGVLKDYEYFNKTLTMSPGDSVFLFTDGVNEACDKDNNEFSNERLMNLLQSASWDSTEKMTHLALGDVESFVDGADQSDDITIMVASYFGISK